MKKCETFDDLQALGTEKIHEQTHISRDKVELILTKSYGEIGKVQFMGFLSILERDYGVDLNEIRSEYLQYQNEHATTFPPKHSVVLQPHSNGKQKWIIAGAALIAILIGGGYALQNFLSNEPQEELMKLSTPIVEAVSDAIETNATLGAEANVSEAVTEVNATAPSEESIIVAKDLTIRPIYKVWVGMIDVATGEKNQKITSDPITIDAGKNLLIVLGHGRVEIASSAGNKVLKEKDTVYFAHENGELKQLSKEEFVQRNGGKNW